MQKAEVKGGIVVNIIEVDPLSIPDWCADWPDAVESTVIGWPYVEPVLDTPAET